MPVDQRRYLVHVCALGVAPFAASAVRIDGGDPPLGGLGLDFLEFVVALGLENQVQAVVESDDEVRRVFVSTAAVKIGDGKPETLVLDEGDNSLVQVEVVGSRLFPLGIR